ncbi:MAG: hypothetical protein KKB21_02205 [Nanoarchaeota archaeon]|nr:hypothetical protein [Nanoarchaeota archaeon]MBU4086368.1 hypothetical protein [Nanoarchaeota archaeon]
MEKRNRFLPYCFQSEDRKEREQEVAVRLLDRLAKRYEGTPAENAVNVIHIGAVHYLATGGNPRKVISAVAKDRDLFSRCDGRFNMPLEETGLFLLAGGIAINRHTTPSNRHLKPVERYFSSCIA